MDEEQAIEQARAQVGRLLARREHTRRELDSKLAQRGYTGAVREHVIAEAGERGWLDERRFAEEFVRSRVERGQGPLRLRSELHKRGLAEELIDSSMATYQSEHGLDWREFARQVRTARFGVQLPRERREVQRQAQFLQRRGFTAEQISAAIGGSEHYGE